ncbi:MAG TPA: hypothetical protein VFQ35_17875 [Polyangiaceae bacterium]|nr:hypothetical protein [Polyangiaceae bacterium]
MSIDAFIRKLENCLNELVTLNIVTAVGAAKLDVKSGDASGTKVDVVDGSTKVIWTAINLAQGDITTVIDPEFQGDAGKELREFHKSRETQGLEIIRGNISALKELVSLLGAAVEHKNTHPAGSPAVAPKV